MGYCNAKIQSGNSNKYMFYTLVMVIISAVCGVVTCGMKFSFKLRLFLQRLLHSCSGSTVVFIQDPDRLQYPERPGTVK